MHACLALMLAVAMVGVGNAPAQAIENLRKYAGIVVDAKTGEVLYESAADERRYPASVAKVMTLYILFQELEAGNLSLSTPMTVSRHAAAAVPTKLGLKAGSTISVEDAIMSLVTVSANDMARVIAEHISGTESRFAQRMTATAHALGMRSTTYKNASGLPDGGQVTTVRDQAILGIAIYQHFPQYYGVFQTKSFKYGGRTFGNHNRVLGYMGAVDGIKTGYINAAGSNLLTAARKDDRHIVVVAFGFNSSAARDKKVRELVKAYLYDGRSGTYLASARIPLPGRQGGATVRVAAAPQPRQPVYVRPAPMPGFRLAQLVRSNGALPAPTAQTVTASLSAPARPVPAPAPAPMPIDVAQQQQSAVQATYGLAGPGEQIDYSGSNVIGAWLSESYSLGAPPAVLGQTAPSAPLSIDFGVTNSTGSNSASAGGWAVQIAAAPSEDSARAILADATSRLDFLVDYRPAIDRIERDGTTFYRARFVGFGDRGQAETACRRIEASSLDCMALGG